MTPMNTVMRKPIILLILFAILLGGCQIKTTYEVNGKEITKTIIGTDTIIYIDGKQVDKASDKSIATNHTVFGNESNEATLAHLAMNDSDAEVRKLAVSKTHNEATLAHVAMNDVNAEVRKLAVGRISNEATLAHVALS